MKHLFTVAQETLNAVKENKKQALLLRTDRTLSENDCLTLESADEQLETTITDVESKSPGLMKKWSMVSVEVAANGTPVKAKD